MDFNINFQELEDVLGTKIQSVSGITTVEIINKQGRKKDLDAGLLASRYVAHIAREYGKTIIIETSYNPEHYSFSSVVKIKGTGTSCHYSGSVSKGCNERGYYYKM